MGDILAEQHGVFVLFEDLMECHVYGGDHVDRLAFRLCFRLGPWLANRNDAGVDTCHGLVRFRIGLCALDGIDENFDNRCVQLGLLRLGEKALLDQVLAHPGDRVLLAPRFDFLPGPIERVVVVGRMGVVAIGISLDERRSLTGTCSCHSLLHCVDNFEWLVAVDRYPGESVALGPVGDPPGNLFGGGHRNGVVVVLDYENEWKIVNAGPVHGLVPVTFRRRTLSSIDDCHGVAASIH